MSVNAQMPMTAIVVAGDGLIAHLAALALRQALPRAAVTLVAAPPDPDAPIDTAEQLPALFPAARAAAEGIGLDLTRLAGAGLANHRLADRFAIHRAPAWLRAFGDPGGAVGPGAFHQLWLEACRRGEAHAYHAYSPAAALAEAGRYAPPVPGAPALLARTDAALRLAPALAGSVFARELPAARIATPAAPLSHALRDVDDAVTAVALADGTAVAGDLFVDCTGPAARLAGGSWQDWDVGGDRMLIGPVDPPANVLTDDHHLTPIGWRGTVPLPGATTRWGLWRADTAGEGRARSLFGSGARGRSAPIRAGRRTEAFRGRVVALGGAAAEPGPMMATGLSLALAGLDLLLELLPAARPDPGERREYNRRFAALAERACDFATLPAHIVGGATASPALAASLVQFRARGTLIRPEEDLFEPEDWIGLMLGLGIVPERRDPVAMSADRSALRAALDRLARAVAAFPAQLPSYRDVAR